MAAASCHLTSYRYYRHRAGALLTLSPQPFNTSSREIESLSAENVLGGKMIDWKLGLFIEMRCIVRMLRAVKISDIFLAIKGQYKKYNQFMAKSC